jgi:hypothetical protein
VLKSKPIRCSVVKAPTGLLYPHSQEAFKFFLRTWTLMIILQLTCNCCRRKNLSPEDKIEYFISEKKDTKRVKAHINAQFFSQLKFLIGEYRLRPQALTDLGNDVGSEL